MSSVRRIVFIRVDNNEKVVIDYHANPIGQPGAFGSVYDVLKVNDSPVADWVIKLLLRAPTPAYVDRLVALCDFLNDGSLNIDGLSCVPATVLRAEANDLVGVVMRKAPGPDLSVTKKVPNAALPHRLAAAFELARSVEKLHRSGAIVGDIAHDNVIVNKDNSALYVIDLDGIAFSLDGRHYPLDSRNDAKGEVAPPEVKKDVEYGKAQDLWSLAVLLHDLLLGSKPMRLFGLALKYGRKPVTPINWPPPGHQSEVSHLSNLSTLGNDLKALFLRSFNRGHSNPDDRPTASEWVYALDRAQDNIYRCLCDPDNPYITLGPSGPLTSCPRCNASITNRHSAPANVGSVSHLG